MLPHDPVDSLGPHGVLRNPRLNVVKCGTTAEVPEIPAGTYPPSSCDQWQHRYWTAGGSVGVAGG